MSVHDCLVNGANVNARIMVRVLHEKACLKTTASKRLYLLLANEMSYRTYPSSRYVRVCISTSFTSSYPLVWRHCTHCCLHASAHRYHGRPPPSWCWRQRQWRCEWHILTCSMNSDICEALTCLHTAVQSFSHVFAEWNHSAHMGFNLWSYCSCAAPLECRRWCGSWR